VYGTDSECNRVLDFSFFESWKTSADSRRMGFEGAISSLTAQAVRRWETSPAVFPTNMPKYGRSEKGANEKRIRRVLDDQDKRRDLQTLFRHPGRITGSTLRRLAITDLFVLPDAGNSHALPSGQFADATADFVRKARMFDPDIIDNSPR